MLVTSKKPQEKGGELRLSMFCLNCIRHDLSAPLGDIDSRKLCQTFCQILNTLHVKLLAANKMICIILYILFTLLSLKKNSSLCQMHVMEFSKV